ncbi:hypothetical protein BD770DRAFT_415706 [Pilaira anomala]|nr:hypothetical protein BD770DRAFT_415706 [Pilaira anomala]
MVTTRNGKKKETPQKRKPQPELSSSSEHTSKKHKGKEPAAIQSAAAAAATVTAAAAAADMDTTDVTHHETINNQEENNEAEESIEEEEFDDDEIDWETIQLPSTHVETYNDIEIVMDSTIPQKPKRSAQELAYQRSLRDWIHNCHILCLIAHFKLRNIWCSRPEFKFIIPQHIQSITDQTDRLKSLLAWWREYFKLTGPGLQSRPPHYFNYISNRDSLLLQVTKSNEDSDYIPDFESFIQFLHNASGTRDTSAELFVALLRSTGFEARLVCSLQPVPYKLPIAPKQPTPADTTTTTTTIDSSPSTTTVEFKFRTPTLRPYVDTDTQLKQPKSKAPTVWAEIFCTKKNRWICIDPIRGLIDTPLRMEPALMDRTNRLSMVLGFDPVDAKRRFNITDLTQRYTCHFERALKERERPLSQRESSSGLHLWTQTVLDLLTHKNKLTSRDLTEQTQLAQRVVHEVMPKAIGKFNHHPLYALERHLKKYEILYPKDPVLGFIRGETIYPRKCVKTLKTAEMYRKLGRVVKKGEQPLKMVQTNPVTLERKRLKERANMSGDALLIGCYGEWQTELYVPPPVINGRIPKNEYGTIDLFTPTMLPKGAAHIPIKGISKMAKKLGIDYADAVTGFDYVKMKSVPILDGIVIAEESKQVLLEAWEEHDQNESMKAFAKQEKETLLRWRKLIKSLLIKARVDQEYGKEKEQEDVWSSYKQEGGGGGGFLPED